MTDILSGSGSSGGTSSSAGTKGTFPQGQGGQATSADLAALNRAYTSSQWAAARGITSTELPFYTTNGKLNANAFELEQYYMMDESQRLQLQDELVSASLLKASDATGLPTSAGVAALRSAQQNATSLGLNLNSYLQQQATGTNAIENQIASQSVEAQKLATAPVTATLENPTTLSQALSNAVDQTLGYTPANMQSLINDFVGKIHGQDMAVAQAPRAEAAAMTAQAKSEQSALNKLGPDGIDSVIQAYQNAVHGLPGGAEGPVVGTNPAGQQTNPAQASEVPGTFKPGATTTAPGETHPSALSAIVHNAENVIPEVLHGQPTEQMNQPVPGMKTTTAPGTDVTATSRGTFTKNTPIYGGAFALSPAQWKKAQTLFPAAKKYSSAGKAPEAIQHAAFTALLQNSYDTNGGNWASAVTAVASGSPLGKVKGAGLSAFATGVANQVNTELSNLQSQVNNASVTTRVTAPDYQAEALQAAKQADPAGYYASNYASWGSLLSKALYGTPLSEMQSTADTFTGPVGSTSAGASAAPAPTAAPVGGK